MKRRLLVILMIAALGIGGAAFTASAIAQASGDADRFAESVSIGGPRARFRQRILGRLAWQLGITAEQKEQIKQIIASERTNIEPLVKQLAATRKQIHDATAGGKFDEAQVSALASQQGQTLASLIVVRERVKSKIYTVLTDEQRAKLDQMRSQFEGRIRERGFGRN